ncbi:MAG: IreB family regulatory phosphoprotein [Tissierellia bacterium]|nr:IreB family regulatory phosphoprotein [Tissierellia bacterium]
MKFESPSERADEVREILFTVYGALEEKGYDPINQIIGYILSGDPTYITSHSDARSIIRKVERDELLEEVLEYYLKDKK